MYLIVVEELYSSINPSSRITSFESREFQFYRPRHHCLSSLLPWLIALILPRLLPILYPTLLTMPPITFSAPSRIMPRIFKLILNPWWFPWFHKMAIHALMLWKLTRVLKWLLLPLKSLSLPWFLFLMFHLISKWWWGLWLHGELICEPWFSYLVRKWLTNWLALP